ncbi:uncharacterized protein LOC127122792 [Lathyrus oleraceus]|uniref:uncharacterized protein LOC127122792 n=1 Tax=Pisum sativum TaxID=3888 RepID=UPI0021CF59FA|nr:uncharacterized protein LOC127122792 [Pisum sativum]
MKLCKERREGGFYLMIHGAAVPSVVLPCSQRTYVRHARNWTYNLDAPPFTGPLPPNVPMDDGQGTDDEDAEIRLQERLAREVEERARQEVEEKERQEELQRIRDAEAKALADVAAAEVEAKAKADTEEAARLAKEPAAKARNDALTQGESSNSRFFPLVLKTLEELQKEK